MCLGERILSHTGLCLRHKATDTERHHMLNYIWAFMILVGVLYAAFTGRMDVVTEAALNSAQEAVNLCITMAGVMALWMGLMKIAEKSGLITGLASGIQPFLTFMFPRIPKNHESRKYIATNFIANILGLGWACTPAGLKAMESLAKLEEERGNEEYKKCPDTEDRTGDYESDRGARGEVKKESLLANQAGGEMERLNRPRRASNEMCTFLILNISSLQLIPVNMIVYRTQYGSANPAAVIAPAIVATLFSTIIAIICCKVMDRKKGV